MHFWEIIASNAVVAGVLAIAVALVSKVWRNPAALHLLWVIVLVKLFMPPLFFSPLSFATKWLPAELTSSSSEQISRSAALNSTVQAPTDAARSAGMTDQQVADTDLNSLQHSALAANSPSNWSTSRTLAVIWILGSSCVALIYAVRIRRFSRLISGLESPPQQTATMANELGRKLGLRRMPNLFMTSQALPPLVWSIGARPRVILPSQLFGQLSSEAQSSIVAHELIHVRRGDHLVRLLELLATTFFWWHPVVWWASSQLHELEEQCCDSRALELLHNQARTYASALVETLEFLADRPRVIVPLPTTVHSTGSLTKRIQMLARPGTNRMTAKTWLLVAAIAALPLSIVFANEAPSEPTAGKAENKAPANTQSEVQPSLTLVDSATLKKLEADFSSYPHVLAASAILKKDVAAASEALPSNIHEEVQRSLEKRLAALLASMQEYRIKDYQAAMLGQRLLELATNVTELPYRKFGATPEIRQKASTRYADVLVYAKQQIEQNRDALGVRVLDDLTLSKLVGQAFEDVLQPVQSDAIEWGYGEPLSSDEYGRLVDIIHGVIFEAAQFSSALSHDELNPKALPTASTIANRGRLELLKSIQERGWSESARYAVARELQEKFKDRESLRAAIFEELRKSEQLEIASIQQRTHDEAEARQKKAKAWAEQHAAPQ